MTDIGFTGTQLGFNATQLGLLIDVLKQQQLTRGRHGDCIGADAQFHDLCRAFSVPVTIYPPLDPKKRAFCKLGRHPGDVAKQPRTFLVRNRHIVADCQYLIACPSTDEDQAPRSGTWATVRMARRLNRPHTIIYPSGRIEHH